MHEDMTRLPVKITVINKSLPLRCKKYLSEMVRYFIGFHTINSTLHGRLGIDPSEKCNIYLFIYLYFICHTDKLHDNNIQKRFKNNGEEAKRKLYSLCLVSYNFSKMR